MQPHQQRVVDEHAELNTKLFALHAFIDTPPFMVLDDVERSRLRYQAIAMRNYSTVLSDRIRAFKDEPKASTPDTTRVTPTMIVRFLSWQLPNDFSPDNGISFSAGAHWPSGTNLFNAHQVEMMLEHVLAKG